MVERWLVVSSGPFAASQLYRCTAARTVVTQAEENMQSRSSVVSQQGNIVCCPVAGVVAECEQAHVAHRAGSRTSDKDVWQRRQYNERNGEMLNGDIRQVVGHHHCRQCKN